MKKIILLMITVYAISTAQSQSWNITGNANTNPSIHFLGTTNNRPLLFRMNNQPAGRIDSVITHTYFGYGAGKNATGNGNVGIGYRTLYSNTSGVGNTAVGMQALFTTTVGSFNTAVGVHALFQNSAYQNTAFGYSALSSNNTGNSNTATGYYSLTTNSSGYNNVGNGSATLRQNYDGNYNTAIGTGAQYANTSGSFNVAVGGISLYNTTTSFYNTVVGFQSCYIYNMGWNNTILGANCEVNANDRYNCIAIGQAVTNTANSQARIGNAATNSIGGYANWTNISDGRYKKDINKNVKGLDFIMKLEPVTYHLDVSGLSRKLDESRGKQTDQFTQKAISEKEEILFSGFVAQDVEKAAKEVNYDFSGVDKPQDKDDLYGLRYAEFVVPLVKAVQEQQQMIGELKKENTDLRNRLNKLENVQSNSPVIGDDILAVRPNPANDQVSIHILADNAGGVMIRLYDAKGSAVKEQKATIVRGSNQITLNIAALAKGIYQLSAIWENGQAKTIQVVKQ